MKSKSYLLSFAKAKGSIAAVALAAVLMAANATVASAQNKATESNGTEKTDLFVSLQPKNEKSPVRGRCYLC